MAWQVRQVVARVPAEYEGETGYYNAGSATKTVDVAPYLSVSHNSLNFIASGETKAFSVECNTDRTFSCDSLWLTFATSSHDADVTNITAAANPITAVRTATVIISAEGATTQTILVTQDAATVSSIEPAGASSVTVYSQNGNLVVKSENPMESVSVYDLSGKVLKVAKDPNNYIVISGLQETKVLIVKVVMNDGNVGNYKVKF